MEPVGGIAPGMNPRDGVRGGLARPAQWDPTHPTPASLSIPTCSSHSASIGTGRVRTGDLVTVALPAPTSSFHAGLTARETAVLKLLVEG